MQAKGSAIALQRAWLMKASVGKAYTGKQLCLVGSPAVTQKRWSQPKPPGWIPYYDPRAPKKAHLSRYSDGEVPPAGDKERQGIPLEQHINNWKRGNALFYGPERDYKNFPNPKLKDNPTATIMAVFPESWFKALYPKIGFTGPYVLVFGAFTACLSKEFLISENHYLYEFCLMFGAFIPAMILIRLSKFWKKNLGGHGMTWQERIAFRRSFYLRQFIKDFDDSMKSITKVIDMVDTEIERHDVDKPIYQAMRENVELQLEARYRERMEEVYQNVKKRLDYELALREARNRIEHDHMVNWILSEVEKGITPKLEQETLASCFARLKELSTQHKGTI